MKRHRRILLLPLGFALVVTLVVLFSPRDRQPMYQGKELSQWLIEYGASRGVDAAAAERASNAVHQIGTNALPHLIKWMNFRTPRWRDRLARSVPAPAWLLPSIAGPGPTRVSEAVIGFKILGQDASPAVPQLTKMLGHWEPQRNTRAALIALGLVGEAGLPPLVELVTNQAAPTWVRVSAAARIGNPVTGLGTNANWAVPLLVRYLKDKELGWQVADTLGRLKMQPEIVVPALTEALAQGDPTMQYFAAESLAQFENEAAAATPALLAATISKDADLREAATTALRRIAPQVLENAGH